MVGPQSVQAASWCFLSLEFRCFLLTRDLYTSDNSVRRLFTQQQLDAAVQEKRGKLKNSCLHVVDDHAIILSVSQMRR